MKGIELENKFEKSLREYPAQTTRRFLERWKENHSTKACQEQTVRKNKMEAKHLWK